MNLSEFETDVLRTYTNKNGLDILHRLISAQSDETGENAILMLLEGVMGLSGEAGEAEELVKKHVFQGHVLDVNHIVKELGDTAYYLSLSAHALGYSLDEILRMNIEKRLERYPEGFETDRSIYRKEGDI